MPLKNRIHSLRKRIARGILGSLSLEEAPPELEPIDSSLLHELQRLFPMPKFFIIGYPRSGTTLLMRLVRLHPEVHCRRQAHFFTHPVDATRLFSSPGIREWLARRSNRWTSDETLEAALVRLVADFVMEREAHRVGKAVVGDKSPNTNHELAVRRAHAVYPDGKLIYIVRDGRDAVLSHRFMHFIDQPQLLDRQDRRIKEAFTRDSSPFYSGVQSVFTPGSLRHLAGEWAQNVSETHRLGPELYGDHYLSLRYEDLLGKPVSEMKRVWEFLGVDPVIPGGGDRIQAEMAVNPSAEWHREKEAALVRDLQRGVQGSWRDLFTVRDRQIFKVAGGGALIAWGYEGDLDW